jgi:serine/threonine protein kinase/Tol biopolymer transport system component
MGRDRSRHERIRGVFQAALDRPAAERAAFLSRACAGDTDLHRDVASLLEAHAAAGPFLDRPAVDALEPSAGGPWLVSESSVDHGPAHLFAPGVRFGPYEILGLLGSGGMGDVYRAFDTRLNRDVALKTLSPLFVLDADRLARFKREAQVLALLNHPNIAAIYGLEESDGADALVLELVEGETLADRITRGPIPLDEALHIARQVAEALEAAHQRGIIHRDLKPANVKVRPDGTVKVLDFGLAKALEPTSVGGVDVTAPFTITSPAMTRTGAILGTAAYMSPEQARGQAVDGRSDLWSFGVVLYELVTRVRPFDGPTAPVIFEAVLGKPYEPVRGRNPKVAPELERIIDKLLEKDKTLRYQSAADVLSDLRRNERDSSSARTVPLAAAAPQRRAWWPYAIAAVLVVGLLAGSTALFLSTKPARPVTSPSEYVQLTNFTDAAVAPSLSPDGRMVTFILGGESFASSGQIYVKLLPNGESVRLTHDGAQKYGPVFTPDGSRIAYTKVTLDWDTWTVPVLGGSPARLLPNASGLTWIADHRVLFSEIKGGALHMGIVTATESRAESREIYFPASERGMAHYSYASPDRQSVLVVEMDQTHAFHQPCRLVPFAGSSAGRQVGPQGVCTSAAWSPDGAWMYFGARVAGSSHLWRQKYPNGTPEQITFGPTEEEGVALVPDGRSLVTSVGSRRSVIWIHDTTGERAISPEGYAVAPRLSRDGIHVFYLLAGDLALSGAVPGCNCGGWLPSSAELRSMDLGSGKSDTVLPGVSITDYDISRDEKEVAFTTTDTDGESTIWLASLDRRTPPREIARAGDQVSFGAGGELIFRSLKENNALVRIKNDGTGRDRITTTPVLDKWGVSPDGKWVLVWSPGAGDKASPGTLAIPTHGGTATKVCDECWATWSADGRFFYVASDPGSRASPISGKTLAIPVPVGTSLPNLPATGVDFTTAGLERLAARVLGHDALSPGPDPSTYVFTKSDSQRNLFRIPLH